MAGWPSWARRVYGAADHVAVALFVLLVVLINVQVFWRYVLVRPLSWPEEIARATFIWIVYVGLIKVVREESWYRIDFVLLRLPDLPRRVVLVLLDLVAIAFFVAVLSDSWLVISSNWGIRTSIAMPVNVIYLSLPVSLLLILPLLVGSVLTRLGGGDPRPKVTAPPP